MRLKENIIEKIKAHFSTKEISEALNCSQTYVRDLKWRLKKAKWSSEWSEQKTAYKYSLEKKYAKIKAEIEKNPRKSIRAIARHLKLPVSSTAYIIKYKLGYRSRIRKKNSVSESCSSRKTSREM